MHPHPAITLRDGTPTIDWEVVEQLQRRARRLRSEAATRALGAPFRRARERVARALAPLDFAPIGTCP